MARERSRTKGRRRTTGVSFETVRDLALALPGVEEGTSYGTPALRVRGRLVARLKEDGESLVVMIDMAERETLLHAEPETFYITEHYRSYPAMLVRLAKVGRAELRDLLEQSWRRAAPKRVIEDLEARRRRR
jgi:hypothetical protein